MCRQITDINTHEFRCELLDMLEISAEREHMFRYLLFVFLSRGRCRSFHSVCHHRISYQCLQQCPIAEVWFWLFRCSLLLLMRTLPAHMLPVRRTATVTHLEATSTVVRLWRSWPHWHPLPAWPTGPSEEMQDLLFGRFEWCLLFAESQLFRRRRTFASGAIEASTAFFGNVVQVVVLTVDPAWL